LYILQTFVYLINRNTNTNKKIMKNSTTVNENRKANFIAFGIMAVILIIGVIYGMQLENAFYLTENY
jgi:uncharacterized membrane protein